MVDIRVGEEAGVGKSRLRSMTRTPMRPKAEDMVLPRKLLPMNAMKMLLFVACGGMMILLVKLHLCPPRSEIFVFLLGWGLKAKWSFYFVIRRKLIGMCGVIVLISFWVFYSSLLFCLILCWKGDIMEWFCSGEIHSFCKCCPCDIWTCKIYIFTLPVCTLFFSFLMILLIIVHVQCLASVRVLCFCTMFSGCTRVYEIFLYNAYCLFTCCVYAVSGTQWK